VRYKETRGSTRAVPFLDKEGGGGKNSEAARIKGLCPYPKKQRKCLACPDIRRKVGRDSMDQRESERKRETTKKFVITPYVLVQRGGKPRGENWGGGTRGEGNTSLPLSQERETCVRRCANVSLKREKGTYAKRGGFHLTLGGGGGRKKKLIKVPNAKQTVVCGGKWNRDNRKESKKGEGQEKRGTPSTGRLGRKLKDKGR